MFVAKIFQVVAKIFQSATKIFQTDDELSSKRARRDVITTMKRRRLDERIGAMIRERMKKFWRMLRVGGASLRFLADGSFRKYADLTWDDVLIGQRLAFVVLMTPALALCVCAFYDWKILGAIAAAIFMILCPILGKPIPESESRSSSTDEIDAALENIRRERAELFAEIEAKAKEKGIDLHINNKVYFPLSAKYYPFKPNFAVAPGEILEDHLEMKNVSHEDAARRLGMTARELRRLIKGETELTADLATRLEKAFDVPAFLWLNAERNYREWLARKN